VVAIKNIGDADATNVHWSITPEGGTIFIGRHTSGENLSIPAGGQESISSSIIMGFGQTRIIVEVWMPDGPSDTREQTGFVLLFFIKVNPGG